jgi:hypothetical protein
MWKGEISDRDQIPLEPCFRSSLEQIVEALLPLQCLVSFSCQLLTLLMVGLDLN